MFASRAQVLSRIDQLAMRAQKKEDNARVPGKTKEEKEPKPEKAPKKKTSPRRKILKKKSKAKVDKQSSSKPRKVKKALKGEGSPPVAVHAAGDGETNARENEAIEEKTMQAEATVHTHEAGAVKKQVKRKQKKQKDEKAEVQCDEEPAAASEDKALKGSEAKGKAKAKGKSKAKDEVPNESEATLKPCLHFKNCGLT